MRLVAMWCCRLIIHKLCVPSPVIPLQKRTCLKQFECRTNHKQAQKKCAPCRYLIDIQIELAIYRLVSGAFCKAFGNQLIAAAIYSLDVFAIGRF